MAMWSPPLNLPAMELLKVAVKSSLEELVTQPIHCL